MSSLWIEQIAWYQRLQVTSEGMEELGAIYPFPTRPDLPDYYQKALDAQLEREKEEEQQKRAAEAAAVITHSEAMKERLARPRKKLAEGSFEESEDVT